MGVKPVVQPKALSIWKRGDVASDPLRSIRILNPGPERQGLIGYFRDDAGGTYIMLTNLWRVSDRQKGLAANTRLTFRLVFDPAVRSILRLDRETGKTQRLTISNPAEGLTVTLPGGTGDLFKIGEGTFPGLTAP